MAAPEPDEEWELRVTPPFEKEFRKLEKPMQVRVRDRLAEIREDPNIGGLLRGTDFRKVGTFTPPMAEKSNFLNFPDLELGGAHPAQCAHK